MPGDRPMRRRKIFRYAAVGIAGLGLTLPLPASAAHPAPLAPARKTSQSSTATDVALQAGGLLRGQIVDAQGSPMANAAVSLQFEGRAVAAARTTPQGYFAVSGLRGGTFQVTAAGGSGVYRLWVENSAPPAASASLLIVAGSDAARGQDPSWGSGPSLVMLGVMGGIVTSGVIAAGQERPES
jgi:hypothetical protein